MMEIIKKIFTTVAETIDVLGVLILLYGFTKALIRFFKVEFGKGELSTKLASLQSVR